MFDGDEMKSERILEKDDVDSRFRSFVNLSLFQTGENSGCSHWMRPQQKQSTVTVTVSLTLFHYSLLKDSVAQQALHVLFPWR